MNGPEDLAGAVAETRPGQRLRIRFRRDGQQREAVVVLDERSAG